MPIGTTQARGTIMHPTIMAAAMGAAASLRIQREREEEQKLIDEGLCCSNAEARRLLHPSNKEALAKIRAKRTAKGK